MSRTIRSLQIGAVMMLPVVMAACGDTGVRDVSELSIENQLASIHQGGTASAGDPVARMFGDALDRLEAKCPESRQRIADMGVTGWEMMRDKGLNESLLAVLNNWRAAIPNETQDGGVGPCADILALYVTLRIGNR